MVNGQSSVVSVGIADSEKKIAVYVNGTADDVLSILSKEFSGNMYVVSGDQLTTLMSQTQTS